MRILHVIPQFSWQYGGSQRVVYDLSKVLHERGHDVTIYTTDEGMGKRLREDEKIVFDNNQVLVRYFPCISNWMADKLKLHISPSMMKALREEITDFDIIHLHQFRGLTHLYAWYYAKKYRKPYILQGHNSTPLLIENQGSLRTIFKKFYDNIIGDRIVNDAAKLIAVSREEVEYYQKLVFKKNITLIYNGIDLEPFKQLPEYGKFRKKYGVSGKMLLYLGRINSTKGIDFSLKAFRKVLDERSDLTMVIAGSDDGFKGDLEGLIERLGIEDKVIFTGFLDDYDKISAYLDADIFLHTVVYMGGVALTPLESILCNTPVVVTKECGEIIEDAECGYLVEYGDVNDLKDKILKLIEDKSISEEMIHKGKKFITRNLGWSSTVRNIEKIYEDCT